VELNKSTLNIGGKFIGAKHPTFIIAEAGVNHNGDLNLAKELIKSAKSAGADCVKFQTFKAERVVSIDAPKADYQNKTTDPKESQFDMLKKLEISNEYYSEIIECCHENEIIFMSTPYNTEDADFLYQLGVPAFKLASLSAVEPWFASYVSKKGKPVILSTGMASLKEVDNTVKSIFKTGNKELILLQCTTNYPSIHEDGNLLAMQTMHKEFGLNIGYSDHTQDDTACILSIGLGATVIEKHLTLDKTLPGPDHSSSYEPKEFKRLVQKIRIAEKLMGSRIKEPSEVEKKNSFGMRRSIVASKLIPKGTILSEKMLTLKRPASGISPENFEDMLGYKTKVDILKDSQIKWSELEK
jgi:N,N'-diacetyllegionaminate synthase